MRGADLSHTARCLACGAWNEYTGASRTLVIRHAPGCPTATLDRLTDTIDAWEDGLLGANSRDDARLREVVDAPAGLIAQLDDYRWTNADAIRTIYAHLRTPTA